MATLAEQGRITLAVAEEEIMLLKESWQLTTSSPDIAMEIDLFDRRQLETVLEVCQRSASLSEAGRELFAVSRQKRPILTMLTAAQIFSALRTELGAYPQRNMSIICLNNIS
jgi:sigma54-dependent transcription regulator